MSLVLFSQSKFVACCAYIHGHSLRKPFVSTQGLHCPQQARHSHCIWWLSRHKNRSCQDRALWWRVFPANHFDQPQEERHHRRVLYLRLSYFSATAQSPRLYRLGKRSCERRHSTSLSNWPKGYYRLSYWSHRNKLEYCARGASKRCLFIFWSYFLLIYTSQEILNIVSKPLYCVSTR